MRLRKRTRRKLWRAGAGVVAGVSLWLYSETGILAAPIGFLIAVAAVLLTVWRMRHRRPKPRPGLHPRYEAWTGFSPTGGPVVTALYRQFDAGGRLLYVGIANNPLRRTGEHAAEKPWFTQVVRIDIQWLPDRDAALEAEEHAIKTERPLFNIVHNGRAA